MSESREFMIQIYETPQQCYKLTYTSDKERSDFETMYDFKINQRNNDCKCGTMWFSTYNFPNFTVEVCGKVKE